MRRFQPAGVKWWGKPLVRLASGRFVPAELAVLGLELCPVEEGVWMNSRGTKSGVIDLIADTRADVFQFRTRRAPLPLFVAAKLQGIYRRARLAKGCPDLVIWRAAGEVVRLVEVKCPHWDAPTVEQERFMRTAGLLRVPTRIVEWEFEDVSYPEDR